MTGTGRRSGRVRESPEHAGRAAGVMGGSLGGPGGGRVRLGRAGVVGDESCWEKYENKNKNM